MGYNIFEDRPQLVRVVLLYLNNNFGNLTPKTSSEKPNLIFYVDSDNEVLMEYNKENGIVYIHYHHIWSKLDRYFSLEYDHDIVSIMKVWLERDYNLRNLKRPTYLLLPNERWRGLKFK
jgi:hypothetical protein